VLSAHGGGDVRRRGGSLQSRSAVVRLSVDGEAGGADVDRPPSGVLLAATNSRRSATSVSELAASSLYKTHTCHRLSTQQSRQRAHCVARPPVTFPASLPTYQYHIILLGGRRTTCSQSLCAAMRRPLAAQVYSCFQYLNRLPDFVQISPFYSLIPCMTFKCPSLSTRQLKLCATNT